MELRTAAFADRLEGDGALGELGAVRIGQNRNFLYLVLIDVGGLGSLIAWVEQVGAIHRHSESTVELRSLRVREHDPAVLDRLQLNHHAIGPSDRMTGRRRPR